MGDNSRIHVSVSRAALVLAVCLASPVAANPLEVFGLTSRRAGQANTGIASAEDASALYYDPAGLVAAKHAQLSFGLLGAYSHLAIGTAHPSFPHPYSTQLAISGPVHARFAVGVALHLSPRFARLVAPEVDDAVYPYYADRTARIVALPGIAALLGGGVSAGASLDVLPGVTLADDARAPAVSRALLGLRWVSSPSLRLGAVYRQRFHIPYRVGERTAYGQYTPHELGAGAAITTDVLVVSLDLGWAHWARYRGPFADGAPQVPFKDTFAVRLGLESTSDDGAVFRGGYGFESSAVPAEQTGVTNLLDGSKHTATLGAGYLWPHAAGGKALRVDAHLQVQVVANRRLEKTVWDGTGEYDPLTSIVDEDPSTDGVQTENPGYPTLKSGGEVISAGLTLAVDL